MNVIKKLGTVIVLMSIAISSSAFALDKNQKLFVNLTSNEINRAAMAISYSTKVLTQLEIPVTIYLNVEGVWLADKNIPEHKHVSGKSLKEMLSGFMKAGGKVILCGMCMENIGGITKDEVIEGVEIGPGLAALFAEGTTVLSY
ncbi:MAG: hypothetical protein DRR06_07085 [Gammaproteobacteria bacterium]|nr:MAG: hypothetical protein DRR06_07085 [Gammaproteobacteria bacterium]RLA52172.1 MAG: hypothetical protein DRR42_08290 [Gammaproteobacteria bacterium]